VNDVIDTQFFGDLNRAIATSIVNDECFNYVYPVDFVRKITDRCWQCRFFIEAWDLYD